MLHTYGSWEVFFSAAPTAQNSPELPFRFINSFIQLSRVGSLIRIVSFVHFFGRIQETINCFWDLLTFI